MNFGSCTLDQALRWIGVSVLTVLFVPMGLYLTHRVSASTEQNLAERGDGVARTLAAPLVAAVLLEDCLTLHADLHKDRTNDTEVRYIPAGYIDGD